MQVQQKNNIRFGAYWAPIGVTNNKTSQVLSMAKKELKILGRNVAIGINNDVNELSIGPDQKMLRMCHKLDLEYPTTISKTIEGILDAGERTYENRYKAIIKTVTEAKKTFLESQYTQFVRKEIQENHRKGVAKVFKRKKAQRKVLEFFVPDKKDYYRSGRLKPDC